MVKYSSITAEQAGMLIERLRKKIYFLLIILDPKTKENFRHIKVEEAFDNVMCELNGANEIFMHPFEIITTMTCLEAAFVEYKKPDFDFSIYRKLLLEAGSKIKEVDVSANPKSV